MALARPRQAQVRCRRVMLELEDVEFPLCKIRLRLKFARGLLRSAGAARGPFRSIWAKTVKFQTVLKRKILGRLPSNRLPMSHNVLYFAPVKY